MVPEGLQGLRRRGNVQKNSTRARAPRRDQEWERKKKERKKEKTAGKRTLHLFHHPPNVPLQRLIRARKQRQAVLLDLLEVFRRVDTALIQNPTGARELVGDSEEGGREGTNELTLYSKNSVTILVEPLRERVCFRFVAIASLGGAGGSEGY
jgi:hypothetical protein